MKTSRQTNRTQKTPTGKKPRDQIAARSGGTKDFGIDTAQLALGRLPSAMIDETLTEEDLVLMPEDYVAVRRVLRLSAGTGEMFVVGDRTASALDLKFDAVVARVGLGAAGGAEHQRHEEFIIQCVAASGRQTSINVTLRLDPHGRRWLNVRANPTSLLNGSNVVAVSLAGMSPAEEMRCLLRLPFDALTLVLRAIEPDFAWHKSTRRRIKRLLFRLSNIQIFTYLPIASSQRVRFLGFLRAALSTPFGDGAGQYRTLADVLNVRIDSRMNDADDLETLLIVCRAGGRAGLSINQYLKDAKVTTDARTAGVSPMALGGGCDLANAIRLDLTLHEAALRDLMAEAKLGKKTTLPLTAANFVKAARRLDRGKGESGLRSLNWLLHYAFDKRLPLLRLLNYRPSMVKEARKVLEAYNPDAAKLFGLWWTASSRLNRRGASDVSWVQFATSHHTHRLSRGQARSAQRKVLGVGIDLDLPADAYNTMFAQTFVWDMSSTDRHKFCLALEAGDSKTIAKFMAASRSGSAAIMAQISETLCGMLKGAQTPAVILTSSPPALAPPSENLPRLPKMMPITPRQLPAAEKARRSAA